MCEERKGSYLSNPCRPLCFGAVRPQPALFSCSHFPRARGKCEQEKRAGCGRTAPKQSGRQGLDRYEPFLSSHTRGYDPLLFFRFLPVASGALRPCSRNRTAWRGIEGAAQEISTSWREIECWCRRRRSPRSVPCVVAGKAMRPCCTPASSAPRHRSNQGAPTISPPVNPLISPSLDCLFSV